MRKVRICRNQRSVSPSRHHRTGFNRNVAHDIPYFAPPLAAPMEDSTQRLSSLERDPFGVPQISLNRSTATLASS